MFKITEKKVEKKLAAYYRLQNCVVIRQAAFSRKRIDIVKKEKNSDSVTAIEIKLHDWRDGLRQAKINAIACDQSYVAVWHQYSASALKNKELFEDTGIGLIIIDEQFNPRIEIESGGIAPSLIIRNYFCNSNLLLA